MISRQSIIQLTNDGAFHVDILHSLSAACLQQLDKVDLQEKNDNERIGVTHDFG